MNSCNTHEWDKIEKLKQDHGRWRYHHQLWYQQSPYISFLKRASDHQKSLRIKVETNLESDGAPKSMRGKNAYNGMLVIAKLKPLSFFISLSLMHKKAFDNVKTQDSKVKVVLA